MINYEINVVETYKKVGFDHDKNITTACFVAVQCAESQQLPLRSDRKLNKSSPM